MHILVVDDDPEIREQLSRALEEQRYRVTTAADGRKALTRLESCAYDLVLLDIMLPDMDGIAVLRKIRRWELQTPVLMLSALAEVEDRISGLDAGADDYLPKPFSMAELFARVRALLRRTTSRTPLLQAGGLLLDPAGRSVSLHGEPVELTAKEFAILEFLLYNKERAVSRFDLAEHVWGDDYDPFTMSNVIEVHIKNLRRKIDTPGRPSLIVTVRGVGYRIDASPQRTAAPPVNSRRA